MKKLNFETSKGKFVVVDMPTEPYGLIFGKCGVKINMHRLGKRFKTVFKKEVTEAYQLKIISEQQASEIVEEYFSTTTNEIDGYFDYRDDTQTDCPIESLHSIFELNGYYLFENPNKDPGLIPSAELDVYRKAQDKTFFNPIIFKLL